jgi:lysophospholipase L1-like esterase/pimeloyl-ACP methyl ester carboxylesterase
MTPSRCAAVAIAIALLCCSAALADGPAGLSADERDQIDRDVKELHKRLWAIRDKTGPAAERPGANRFWPDAAVYLKAVLWTLRYEPKLEPADVSLVQKALKRCRERVEAIEADKVTWRLRAGKGVRGFVSEVDGSVQPYGIVVPKGHSVATPARLDVVLHGSTKPTGMADLRFLFRFDEGDGPPASAPEQDFIELHPLGRVENCYRWAGETDVFEAIDDVGRQYMFARRDIVLRGMSMGASGTWHLGLKYPDRFVALGPYCGYVDTHEFSKTPMPNFVPVSPLPAHQEAGLHLLDSIDYAANAGMVPVVAAMGEKDPFFQAHVLMGKAMEKEGLKLMNLIAPGTGHVIDPATHKEQMRRIAEFAAKPRDMDPKHVRFVTWTLKYPKCEWLTVTGLEEHYRRAEIDATIGDDMIEVKEPVNVTRFQIHPDVLLRKSKVRIGQTDIPWSGAWAAKPQVFAKKDGKWTRQEPDEADRLGGKAPGLQGPIDDAFTRPFLCVRGTGKPWNPAVQAWADATLKRFADEWARYFRGDLAVKNDKDVTDVDVMRFNLILFGDPGSNSLIARVLPKLPITWTRDQVVVDGRMYSAASYAPVLVQPNRLPDGAGNYVVLNSGHTFHEKELSTLNYLLFPRLGDWAVMKVGDPSADVSKEEPVRAGFFDERWLFPGQKPDFALKDGDTVVFLGDSITAARTYGKIVENYTLLRFPDRRVRFVNAGKGGETASGALARLDEVFSHKPTVLIVAYGINDIGWGTKADEEHKKQYLDGIRGIVERARKEKTRVYICSAAVTAADPARSENDFLQKMCDEGMALARSLGEHSIDVQRSMREVQKRVWAANEKEKGEKATLHAADGIHLNDLGQLAMAHAILKGLHAPSDVSRLRIVVKDDDPWPDYDGDGCLVERVRCDDGQITFTRTDRGLPFNYGLFFGLHYRFVPVPDDLNRYMLQVEKLPAGRYEITADGRKLGTFTSEQLARGVNLASATADVWEPGGPWDAQAWSLKALTDARHDLALGGVMAKAYLPDGSKELSPGMAKADEELVALQRLTTKPRPYKFVVKPVK